MTKTYKKQYKKNIKKLSELYNNSSEDVKNEIINELVLKTKNIYSNRFIPSFIANNLLSIKPLDKKEK